jgi:hypothetical protein
MFLEKHRETTLQKMINRPVFGNYMWPDTSSTLIIGGLRRENLARKLRFGWKLESYPGFNVTRSQPKKRDLPQSTLDLIAERNHFDIELYECAAKRFQEAIDKNAAKVSEAVRQLEAARIQDPLRSALFSIGAAARKAVNRAYSAV